MKRAEFLYGLTLLAVCVVAFQLGRGSTAADGFLRRPQPTVSASNPTASSATESEPARFASIRVAGFASVGFSEMADLILKAPTEIKNRWAEEIARMPDGPQKRLAAIAFYATWIQFDASAACASMGNFGDHLLRSSVIDSVTGASPASASPLLAEMALHLTSVERTALLPFILREWSSTDPAAVAKFVTHNPTAVTSEDVAKLMENWAEDDLAGARDWLENDRKFSADPLVVTSLVNQWLNHDLRSAAEFVQAHAGSDAFADVSEIVTRALYRVSVDDARGFVESLPADAKSRALASVLDLSLDDRSRFVPALEWITHFPEDEWRDLIGPVLAAWTADDEGSAVGWLNKHSETERSRLIFEMCTSTHVDLTPGVISLALSLSDEASRLQAVRSLLEGVSGEPEEVRQAIAALHLSPRDKTYLLRAGGLTQ